MSLPGQTCRSSGLAALQCSFPEPDIGNGTQHFNRPDDRCADKTDIRFKCAKGCFCSLRRASGSCRKFERDKELKNLVIFIA
ncbi:MAG: hypothetical protein ACI9TA_002475, partial [Reinekea sp.]